MRARCAREKDLIERFVKELNKEIKTKCAEAFKTGNHAEAVMFLPCVQKPKELDCSLLHLAAAWGWADIVEELITKYGIDSASLDSLLKTPLHEAAYNGHIDVVRLLTK